MEKYKELRENLIEYEEECKEALQILEETISKKQYCKRIGSFISPNVDISKLENYYKKRGNIYNLPDCIDDIIVLNDILLIVNDDNKKVSLMSIDDKLYSLECLDSNEKRECMQNIIEMFGFRNILMDYKKLDLSNKNIYLEFKKKVNDILKSHMKELILILRNYIDDEIKDFDIDVLSKESDKLRNKISWLRSYINRITADNFIFIFNKLEEVEKFFDCLKEIKFSGIDINELKEEIINILKEKENKITEQELKRNLNEEELKIYNSIIDLIDSVEHDTYLIGSTSSIDNFKDNFSLEDRIKAYNRGAALDLVKIIQDIKENLLPNIIKHKDEVIVIFKYIIKIYNEYLHNETQKEELEEILSQLRKILKKNKSALEYYNNLSDFNKNYFDKILNEIKNGNYDTFEMMKDHFSKSFDFYELLNTLKDIEFNIEIFNSVINKNIIPQDEFDDLCEMAGEIIEKYDELEYEERFDKKIEYAQNHEFRGKSLIGFMNIDYQRFDNEQKKILQRALIKLFEQSWIDYSINSHENELKPILYKKRNGKVVKLKGSGFDVSRIRINKYRIGIININVCKENNEKILKKYGISGPFIIFLEPFPILGADHNKYYEYIVDVINNNKREIDAIVNLFSNPDSREEDLFKIIEKGILFTKEILNKKITDNEKGQELQ